MIVSKYAFTWSVSEHLLKYNGINELNCERMKTSENPQLYHEYSLMILIMQIMKHNFLQEKYCGADVQPEGMRQVVPVDKAQA